jgi:large subunit ribosomal protein L18
MALSKLERRQRIRYRVRKVVRGTAERPRLSVFRSNKQIYAQLIDDCANGGAGTTLASAGSLDPMLTETLKGKSKQEKATAVGKLAAQRSISKGITNVVFDRSGYLYHGCVKALADAAREAGLKC